ncbi:hypothetical protein ACFLSQ_09115, partial [Bacteroidota bacterium]
TLAPSSGSITANVFAGTGSSTNAVDLATAEVNGVLPDANVADALTITGGTISGGTIDNTPIAIGGTPAAASFTTLGVTGAANLQSTLGVTGNTTVGGTLGVTGAATLNSTLNVNNAVTMTNILDVDGIVNMNSTQEATSTITGALVVDGGAGIAKNLYVGGNADVAGTLGVTGLSTLASVDIDAGAVDGTTVGTTTPAAASFTTIGMSGDLVVGGTITGDGSGLTNISSSLAYGTGTVVGNAYSISDNVSVIYLTSDDDGAEDAITLPTGATNGQILYVVFVDPTGDNDNANFDTGLYTTVGSAQVSFVYANGAWFAIGAQE